MDDLIVYDDPISTYGLTWLSYILNGNIHGRILFPLS